MWRRLTLDGSEWEVRVVSIGPDDASGEEILEFSPVEATRPTRRLAVPAGAASGISEEDLKVAFVKARPIGGDHYGRPGKRMSDI